MSFLSQQRLSLYQITKSYNEAIVPLSCKGTRPKSPSVALKFGEFSRRLQILVCSPVVNGSYFVIDHQKQMMI